MFTGRLFKEMGIHERREVADSNRDSTGKIVKILVEEVVSKYGSVAKACRMFNVDAVLIYSIHSSFKRGPIIHLIHKTPYLRVFKLLNPTEDQIKILCAHSDRCGFYVSPRYVKRILSEIELVVDK